MGKSQSKLSYCTPHVTSNLALACYSSILIAIFLFFFRGIGCLSCSHQISRLDLGQKQLGYFTNIDQFWRTFAACKLEECVKLFITETLAHCLEDFFHLSLGDVAICVIIELLKAPQQVLLRLLLEAVSAQHRDELVHCEPAHVGLVDMNGQLLDLLQPDVVLKELQDLAQVLSLDLGV